MNKSNMDNSQNKSRPPKIQTLDEKRQQRMNKLRQRARQLHQEQHVSKEVAKEMAISEYKLARQERKQAKLLGSDTPKAE